VVWSHLLEEPVLAIHQYFGLAPPGNWFPDSVVEVRHPNTRGGQESGLGEECMLQRGVL